MGRRYLKAKDVLPEALLAEVSRALNGRSGMLWIPRASKALRNAYIEQLSSVGNTEAEIADRLFLNGRTVRRVLAAMKKQAGRRPSRPTEAKTQEEPHD